MLLQKAFQDKNILILGYGKSGQSSTKLLQNIAKNIFVYDKNFLIKKLNNNKNKIKNKIIFNKNALIFEKNNIFFENNLLNIIKNNKINFCIVSPGFSIFSKEISLLKKHKIKLLSELELGAIFCKGRIFAITGTNGKTTTVNALHHIFKTANKQSFLCGNVGTPITEIAPQTKKNSFVVCEVSSFQMEVCNKYFKPFASAILNLQPDHLDRHKTLQKYYSCKEKILNNNPNTICFANYDDKNILKYLNKNNKKINYFSIKNKIIYTNKLNLIKNNNLLGEYNLSNLMCACELALCADIAQNTIKKAISSFYGLPHRLQVVTKFKNITFINDSKSTNIASTLSALEVVKNKKTILLLGGCEKNLDFSPLVKQNIFHIVPYGETGNKIFNTFKGKTNYNNCELATNLKNAFEKAIETAQNENDEIVILLSPACASFDEFLNYEERGKYFENLVQEFCKNNT